MCVVAVLAWVLLHPPAWKALFAVGHNEGGTLLGCRNARGHRLGTFLRVHRPCQQIVAFYLNSISPASHGNFCGSQCNRLPAVVDGCGSCRWRRIRVRYRLGLVLLQVFIIW
jgi:hypothetical protein